MRRFSDKKPTLKDDKAAVDYLREQSHHVKAVKDLDPLMGLIGDARIVMLGEASHGTHEYYTWRSIISQRLITEKGFNLIAVEGDWPDCYRLNRYIKNYSGSGKDAFEVLHAFKRWPTWMWANWEIIALAEWLCKHNKPLPVNKKVGFYGLDVYSLWESMQAIIDYLRKEDPVALKLAQEAFECFEPYARGEGRSYAYATMMVPEPCTNEVINLLKEIQHKAPQYNSDHENVFSTNQNAFVAVNAEKYYRAMIEGGASSWNVRDQHMMETLERLLEFYGDHAKAIVWAHNTHIGDASATDMADQGMFNIGELGRRKLHDKGVVLVGFGSYEGSVVAGSGWGGKMQKMEVPPAVSGSLENLLHQVQIENNLLLMPELMHSPFTENRIGHRAIGVVYNPARERFGNYVPTILPMRYDAFLFTDKTTALHPLHIKPDGHQTPETYPFGV